MNENLDHKNVLITGAAGGIGKAIVNSFDSDQYNLLLAGTNNSRLEAITKELNADAKYVVCDFSNHKNIENIINKVEESFDNRIDILVNNAGITRDNLAIRMKDEEWLEVINLNLNSTFFLTKEITKRMLKNRYGRIVNISSVVGSSGNIGQANYAASKAGLEGMTKSLALEVSSRGITVNCIAPGFIETAMTKELLEKNKEKILERIPMNKIGSPKDVSSLTKFLASEEASYITGQTFHVNGGMIMS
tara:strand:- start:177 stop:920 length:744 start_codon:yes stop_codon:yes gene_type:complete